jgi:hypothetical protein
VLAGSFARRAVVVLAMTALLLVNRGQPAQASFSDTASTALQVTTATVAPPGNVSTRGTSCLLLVYLHLSWSPSNARNVTGYTVTLYTPLGGSRVLGTTDPTATTFSGSYGLNLIPNRAWFTVTTQTSYGWTAESPPTDPILC